MPCQHMSPINPNPNTNPNSNPTPNLNPTTLLLLLLNEGRTAQAHAYTYLILLPHLFSRDIPLLVSEANFLKDLLLPLFLILVTEQASWQDLIDWFNLTNSALKRSMASPIE